MLKRKGAGLSQMAKVEISEAKIKSLAKTVLESDFFIAGYGHFNLPAQEHEAFIRAIMSNSPKTELQKLYNRLKF